MNGYHVLIVEDDPATGDALGRLFSHRGMVVDVARNVTEGMAFLKSKPHCIILDLMLPDGDGEEILREVRDQALPSKVAVCTGNLDPVRLAFVRGMDPDALFQKPIDFHEVCRVVDSDTSQ